MTDIIEIKPTVIKITQLEFDDNLALLIYLSYTCFVPAYTQITVIYRHGPTQRKLIKNVWKLKSKINSFHCSFPMTTCETRMGLLETDSIKAKLPDWYPNDD